MTVEQRLYRRSAGRGDEELAWLPHGGVGARQPEAGDSQTGRWRIGVAEHGIGDLACSQKPLDKSRNKAYGRHDWWNSIFHFPAVVTE